MRTYRWICLVLVLATWTLPVFSKETCDSRELSEGVEAVQRGDIATAINLFMPIATRGCAEAMHNLGVLTSMMSLRTSKSEGRDLRIDAYMWFTLAARQHPPGPRQENSLKNRTSFVSMTSMTSAQIAEGERLAKAWRAGQDLPAQKPLISKDKPSTTPSRQPPQYFQKYFDALPPDVRTAYVEGNWSTVLTLARPLAKQGHSQAQTLMGLLSYHGDGVPQNYIEAARWYGLAAKQGDHVAQSNLGDMYNAGRGVAKDQSKAFELWGKAAEKGHTIAMANIGLNHAQGIGVEANICQAYKWWRKAAALGGGIGQFNIGTMFESGDGVPTDNLQAYVWVNLAVDHMEPGQDSQYQRAVSKRASFAKRLDPTQLKQVEQLMRERSLKELEATLPSCTQ